jgi:hypothetical protein
VEGHVARPSRRGDVGRHRCGDRVARAEIELRHPVGVAARDERITSAPSTTSGRPERFLSAVCSTGRFSETLIGAPANIASRRAATCRSSKSFSKSSRTSASIRVLE